MKKEWIVKYIIWVAVAISWILVITLNQTNPDMNLKPFWIITAILSLIGVITLIAKKLPNLLNPKEKEISKLSEDEVKDRIRKESQERYWSNLSTENEFPWQTSDTINGNLIYAFLVKLDIKGQEVLAVINASEPRIMISFYPAIENGKYLSEQRIETLMNKKAINPEGKPDRIISRKNIDRFGEGQAETEQIIYHKEEKKEEKEL